MNQESISNSGIKELENFKVFPKHVGVWQGSWLRIDANGKELARFTATLTKKIVNSRWIQTNTYNYADGSTVSNNFAGTVIGEGIVEIIGTDDSSPFSNFKAIAEEHGDNIIFFNLWDKATGALRATETINLVRPDYCVRTSQSFSPDGNIAGFMIIIEHRVD